MPNASHEDTAPSPATPERRAANRWRNIAIALGFGFPAAGWLIFLSSAALMPSSKGGSVPGGGVQVTDVTTALEGLLVTTLWAAAPFLVIARLASRSLEKSLSARPSVVGALVGASSMTAIAWIVLPVMMMVMTGMDSDPAGSAQAWAAYVVLGTPAAGLAACLGWLIGIVIRRTRQS